eukprot:6491118-Amphidinium_carterae.1
MQTPATERETLDVPTVTRLITPSTHTTIDEASKTYGPFKLDGFGAFSSYSLVVLSIGSEASELKVFLLLGQ